MLVRVVLPGFDLVVIVNSGIAGPVRGVGETIVDVRGRPGPLLGAFFFSLGWVGAWGGLVASATRGRHRMRLQVPAGRPLVQGLVISAEGAGELGWHGGGGHGGQMDAWMMVS
jgi:hypothetical protein